MKWFLRPSPALTILRIIVKKAPALGPNPTPTLSLTLSLLLRSISGLVQQSRGAAPLVAGIAVPRAGGRMPRERHRLEAETKSGE